jgi:hypothetical protein
MSTFNKVYSYVADLHHKVHNFATDQIAIALTDTAPTTASTNLASIVSPLAGTNLSGATPFNISTTSSAQTAGAYKLVWADLVLTATGNFGPFRYIAIYNASAAGTQLLGWIDVGSETSLVNGQTFTIDLDQAIGAITGS